MKGMKAKGDKYERDIAEYLNTHVFKSQQCHRAPLSGGGFILSHGGADLTGTHEIFVEAKRTERLNIRSALAQAEKNLATTGETDMPTVITRRNREPLEDSLVTMRLKDWTELYSALMREQGYIQ
jgi:hypothetical protein